MEITSFKRPSEEELAHDFLWRIHRATPGHGHIGVLNRSHYEDVLVVRVDKLVAPKVVRARYEHIHAFEATSGRRARGLAAEGLADVVLD